MNSVTPLEDTALTGTEPAPERLAWHIGSLVTAALAVADGQHGGSTQRAEALQALRADTVSPDVTAARRLATLFRLDQTESDLLMLCIAHALDPCLGDGLAALGGTSAMPLVSESAVFEIFGHMPGRLWNPGGRLAAWKLVRRHPASAGTPVCYEIDPVVPAWIGGALWLDHSLNGVVTSTSGGPTPGSWPVAGLASRIQAAIQSGRPVQCRLVADAGTGRARCAASISRRLGLQALIVDSDAIDDSAWPETYVRLQRFAAVAGAALIWRGARALVPWPSTVAPAPVHFLLLEPGITVAPPAAMTVIEADIPLPGVEERRRLWLDCVPGATQWPQEDVDALAGRYRLGVGDLESIAGRSPSTSTEAAALARELGSGSADTLVQTLECPYTWGDLILPDPLTAALADFSYEVCEREQVWREHGARLQMPREPSLAALFCGPSGCGKTMAAQVIAAGLGLELLRVDLSSVLSKYIGETARNLSRVFAMARRRQAILLFDEADAHFSRRTEVRDAHDRYANADTAHLLQLLDSHRGAVILASNRRSDLDPAFVRRLRHVLEFDRPGPAERRRLWKRALEAVAPTQPASLLPAVLALADAVNLSGAQIRNASITALYRARREGRELAAGDIRIGIDRELYKDGRPGLGLSRGRPLHA